MKKHRKLTLAQVCFFIGLVIAGSSFVISHWDEVIAFWVLASGYVIGGVSSVFRLLERVKELDDWRNILD